MSNKMQIKSNTKGKLSKIIKGLVFSDPYVFITEFFQNSHRAKASKVSIIYHRYDDKITFIDNGKGLKNPDDILTLDYSSWETTTEGFGIGFWSWLAFNTNSDADDFSEVVCSIKSGKYEIEISKSALFKDDEPSVKVSLHNEEPYKGFEVTIKSEMLTDYYVFDRIRERIIEDGEILSYDVFFNDYAIPKKDILGEVEGDFVMSFSNKLYDAKMAVGTSAGRLNVYYEKRKVGRVYIDGYASGAIEIKKGTLNLREPDRKDYVYDSKYSRFEDRIMADIKTMYLEMLKDSDDKMIAKYADEAVRLLSVEDYEKLLDIDDIVVEMEEEHREVANSEDYPLIPLNNYLDRKNEEVQLSIFENNETSDDAENIVTILNDVEPNTSWVSTGEIDSNKETWIKSTITKSEIKKLDRLVINGEVWSKIQNNSDYEQVPESVTNTISVKRKVEKRKKENIINVISKARKKVWVRIAETEDFSELISKAKYYGVKVFIAKNIMYEAVFNNRKVPHISEIKDNITKTNITKNVEIRTDKEKRFLELLMPICKYYKLPQNTFLVGELELKIETKLNDVVVDREYLKNSKNDIRIHAVTDGISIIFDRRALNLKRFTFSNTVDLGKNEFKALMSVLNTIAHELSHLLYGTTDNTVEHYQTQEKIAEEIVMLYHSLS